MVKLLVLIALFSNSAAMAGGLNLEGFIVRQTNETDDGTVFGFKQAIVEYKKSAFPSKETPPPIQQFSQTFCGRESIPSIKPENETPDSVSLRVVCGDATGAKTYLMEPGGAKWAQCRESRVVNTDRVAKSLENKLTLTDCTAQEGWFRLGERGKEGDYMVVFVGEKGRESCQNKSKQIARLLNMAYAEEKLKDWNNMNVANKTREQVRFLNDIATCDSNNDQAAIDKLVDPFFNQTFNTSISMTERQKLAREVTKDVLAKPNGKQILKNCELMAVGINSWIEFAQGKDFYCEPSEVSCHYQREKKAAEIKAANDLLARRLGDDAKNVCCNALPDKFSLLTNGGCVPTRTKSILSH